MVRGASLLDQIAPSSGRVETVILRELKTVSSLSRSAYSPGSRAQFHCK